MEDLRVAGEASERRISGRPGRHQWLRSPLDLWSLAPPNAMYFRPSRGIGVPAQSSRRKGPGRLQPALDGGSPRVAPELDRIALHQGQEYRDPCSVRRRHRPLWELRPDQEEEKACKRWHALYPGRARSRMAATGRHELQTMARYPFKGAGHKLKTMAEHLPTAHMDCKRWQLSLQWRDGESYHKNRRTRIAGPSAGRDFGSLTALSRTFLFPWRLR